MLINLIFILGFVAHFTGYFEKGHYSVIHSGLEHTMQARVAQNSQQSSCLNIQNARIVNLRQWTCCQLAFFLADVCIRVQQFYSLQRSVKDETDTLPRHKRVIKTRLADAEYIWTPSYHLEASSRILRQEEQSQCTNRRYDSSFRALSK